MQVRPGFGSAIVSILQALLLLMFYFWIKAAHIVLVIGWYAGLICLPRVFLALAQACDVQTRRTLHGMGRRLLSFSTLLAVPAVLLGLWLFGVFGVGRGAGEWWLHAKMFFVLLTIVFHFACFIVLVGFEDGKKGASVAMCRCLACAPLLILPFIVGLAVLKPF